MMIRAMNKAAISTAVRAAMISWRDGEGSLIDELVKHLDSMAIPVEIGETVPLDRYNLLLLKFQALEKLIEYYDANANCANQTQA